MSLCEGCEEALDLGGISGRRAFFIFPLLDRLVVPARLVHRRARIPPRLRSRKEMALAKIARGLAVPGKGLRHPGPRCLRPRRDPPWFCLFLPRGSLGRAVDAAAHLQVQGGGKPESLAKCPYYSRRVHRHKFAAGHRKLRHVLEAPFLPARHVRDSRAHVSDEKIRAEASYSLHRPRRLHLWPALVSPEPRQRALHLPSRPASPCGASGSPEI